MNRIKLFVLAVLATIFTLPVVAQTSNDWVEVDNNYQETQITRQWQNSDYGYTVIEWGQFDKKKEKVLSRANVQAQHEIWQLGDDNVLIQFNAGDGNYSYKYEIKNGKIVVKEQSKLQNGKWEVIDKKYKTTFTIYAQHKTLPQIVVIDKTNHYRILTPATEADFNAAMDSFK